MAKAKLVLDIDYYGEKVPAGTVGGISEADEETEYDYTFTSDIEEPFHVMDYEVEFLDDDLQLCSYCCEIETANSDGVCDGCRAGMNARGETP